MLAVTLPNPIAFPRGVRAIGPIIARPGGTVSPTVPASASVTSAPASTSSAVPSSTIENPIATGNTNTPALDSTSYVTETVASAMPETASTDPLSALLEASSWWPGVPNWVIAGGGGILAILLFKSRKKGRR